MSTPITSSTVPTTAKTTLRPRSPRTVGGVRLGQQASTEARRLAAAILEVLAGVRTTDQAAAALGLSVMRYYQVEARALAGFLEACEPGQSGPRASLERQLQALRRDHERLERELARQQALVRMGQRSIGLTAVVPPPAKGDKAKSKKTRRRRPVARALQVAARLEPTPAAVPEATATGQPARTDSLQQSP